MPTPTGVGTDELRRANLTPELLGRVQQFEAENAGYDGVTRSMHAPVDANVTYVEGGAGHETMLVEFLWPDGEAPSPYHVQFEIQSGLISDFKPAG